MIVFVGGQMHKYWKQRGDLEKELVKKIAELMQEPEMLQPLRVFWEAWEDEETIGGGPTGIFGPGVLTQISDLRKPEGKIHWAGTELATVSTGYMDGAIESGTRVAV
jgi:monoamine oxidase